MAEAKIMDKEDYLEMVAQTWNEIAELKKYYKNKDRVKSLGKDGILQVQRQMAELYGIYYNAFAGALRCGVLFRKKMDSDGYPKISIVYKSLEYSCRDAALRDILKDEYPEITKFPYEDSSASYAKPYVITIKDGVIEKEAELLPGESPEEREARLSKIKAEKAAAERLRAESRMQKELLREKNRQLQKDARGFQYDPDYDHYYSDRLPDVLNELDSSGRDIAARFACVALSALGVVLTLILL